MSLPWTRFRQWVLEAASGTLAALCALAVIAKAGDFVLNLHYPSLLGAVGLGLEAVALLLLCRGRIVAAATLAAGFALASIVSHAFGLLLQECRCLGWLDRLGGSVPIVYAACQGLIAVTILFMTLRPERAE